MNNRYYHDFEPAGFEPILVVAIIIGLLFVILYSKLRVGIRPITDRCRRYHSCGRKAAKISDHKRRCGSATTSQRGLAIIFPSTSFDWKLAFAYVISITLLTVHYHGRGFLQILYNHGYGAGMFQFLLLSGCFSATFIVVQIERFVQYLSAVNLYQSTKKETNETMPVFEEWGLYDKACRKKYDRYFAKLSKSDREIVRSVIPYWEVSEKIRLDRMESFLYTKEKNEETAQERRFEVLRTLRQQTQQQVQQIRIK